MFVNNLLLENWKQAEKALYNFSRVNLFVGGGLGNDQGKSNMLEALDYLLFGNLSDLLPATIRWGEVATHIRAEFRHQARNGIVDITLTKPQVESIDVKTKRTLKLDGLEDKVTGREALQEMSKFLDAEQSRYSSIAMQEQSRNVLGSDNGDRSERLRKLLGVDRTERMVDRAKERVGTLQAEIEYLRREATILESKNYDERPVPDYLDTMELEKIKLFLLSKQKEYEDLVKAYEEEKRQKEEWDKKKIEIDVVIQSNKDLREKIDELENKKKKVIGDFDKEKYENAVKEKITTVTLATNARQRVAIQSNNYLNFSNKFAEAKLNYETKQKDYENKKRLYEASEKYDEKIVNESESELKKIIGDYATINQELKQDYKDFELVKAGKCPTCGQVYNGDIVDLQEIIKIKDDRLTALRLEKATIESVISIHQKNRIAYETLKNTETVLDQLKIVYDTAKSDLERNGEAEDINEITDTEKHFIKLVEDLEIIKNEIEMVEKTNKGLDSEITKINIEIGINDGKINEFILLPVPTMLFHNPGPFLFQVELEKNINNLAVAEERNKTREDNIKYNEQLMIQKKLDKEAVNSKRDEADKKSTEMDIEKEAAKQISGSMAPHMLESGMKDIMNIMNDFTIGVFPQYTFEFRKGTKHQDFFYRDSEAGVWTSIRSASGFVRQTAAIGFRVALGTLQGIGLFIGDEGDSDAGIQNSKKLMDQLMIQNFEQFFIVSHKPETVEVLVNDYGARIFEITNGNVRVIAN